MKQHRIELNDMTKDYASLCQRLDAYNEPYELTIDSRNISNVSFYMVIDFATFLWKLKQKDPQYLSRTTIYVYSEHIYDLLYYLFTLARPIAPVKVLYFCEAELKYIKTYFP
jgi:hypothetical protein